MNLRRRQAVLVQDPNERNILIKSLNDPENAYLVAIQLHLKKPISLKQMIDETHFNSKEVKAIYRTFKNTSMASSMVIHRDIIRNLFMGFFKGDTEHYADLIFNTFDVDNNGAITFDKFLKAMSVLCRGSLDEKINWVYNLYDPQKCGFISWHRLYYIITAIDDLIGINASTRLSRDERCRQANYIFRKFNGANSGQITRQQFINVCQTDPEIQMSLINLSIYFPSSFQ